MTMTTELKMFGKRKTLTYDLFMGESKRRKPVITALRMFVFVWRILQGCGHLWVYRIGVVVEDCEEVQPEELTS